MDIVMQRLLWSKCRRYEKTTRPRLKRSRRNPFKNNLKWNRGALHIDAGCCSTVGTSLCCAVGSRLAFNLQCYLFLNSLLHLSISHCSVTKKKMPSFQAPQQLVTYTRRPWIQLCPVLWWQCLTENSRHFTVSWVYIYTHRKSNATVAVRTFHLAKKIELTIVKREPRPLRAKISL